MVPQEQFVYGKLNVNLQEYSSNTGIGNMAIFLDAYRLSLKKLEKCGALFVTVPGYCSSQWSCLHE